ncbi:MAG: methyl-accepting chemotaxis protein [Planctomycetota bacterium]
MTVKTRIFATMVALFLFGAAFAVRQALQEGSRADSMEGVHALSRVCSASARLVHEMQKERGMTAGYLGSKGRKFADKLPKQRELVDARRADYEAICEEVAASMTADFGDLVHAAGEGLGQMKSMRSSVDGLAVPLPKALGYFTGLNGQLLDLVLVAGRGSVDVGVTTTMTAYASFLKGKERIGIERAVLANTFSADRFAKGMFEKLIALVATQGSYFHEFGQIANQEAMDLYRRAQADSSFAAVDAMRQVAIDRAATGGFEIDAEQWFETITKKINCLAAVDVALGERLLGQAGELRDASRASSWFLWGVVLVGVGCAAGALWLLFRTTIQPLRMLTDKFREVAIGDGDLSNRVEFDRKDELGQLADSFNQFVAKVAGVVQNMSHSANSVASASTQLSATAANLSDGSSRMNHQSGSVAAAVEQLSATIEAMASESARVSHNLDAFQNQVVEFRTSVDHVGTQSTQVRAAADAATAAVQTSNSNITALGDAADQIGRVVELIEDIAGQINLLALNATIEAARAGEAGKGFAVVANEVKDLARQTGDATDDIRKRVHAIQSSTHDSIGSMEQIRGSIGKVHEVSEAIAQSTQQQGQHAESLTGSVQSANQATQTVARNVSEASLAAGEISKQVQAVAQQVAETTQAASETREASSGLSRLSEELSSTVRSISR